MGRIKTLIVEDEPNIVELYEIGLVDAEFEKRYAGDGNQALEIYESWHPEIIILDILLPVMTGYAVLKQIRTSILDQKTTIIMSTSLSDSNDIRDCIKLGIQGYILKPFKLDGLGKRVFLYHQSHKLAHPA